MYFLTVAVVGKFTKFYFRQFLNAIRQILSVFLMLFNEYLLSYHSAIIGLCLLMQFIQNKTFIQSLSPNNLPKSPEIVKLHF